MGYHVAYEPGARANLQHELAGKRRQVLLNNAEGFEVVGAVNQHQLGLRKTLRGRHSPQRFESAPRAR